MPPPRSIIRLSPSSSGPWSVSQASSNRLGLWMVGVLIALAVISSGSMFFQSREAWIVHIRDRSTVISEDRFQSNNSNSNYTVAKIDHLDGPCKNKSPSALESAVFNITDVKSWSTFPLERTQFTHHILGLIRHRSESITPNNTSVNGTNELFKNCQEVVRFHVSKPYQVPTVTHDKSPDAGVMQTYNYQVMKRIFSNQILPYNVTTGYSYGDYTLPKHRTNPCWANSDLYGQFSVPNMEDLINMNRVHERRGDGPDSYRWPFNGDQIPWHDRQPLPIFRGRLWIFEGGYSQQNATNLARWKAAVLSLRRPDLLNARFSQIAWDVPLQEQLLPTIQNETMREQLLKFDEIPAEEYFRKNQVALVLTGIGAAFRLSNHLMTRTAVILHQSDMQEWYTKYLRPYVHYIPLKNDMSDLIEVLLWVKDHPEQVRTIAEQGRVFWEQFLAFDRHEQHFYELIYRMSEYEHWRSLVGIDGAVIWDEGSNPWPELELREITFNDDEEVTNNDESATHEVETNGTQHGNPELGGFLDDKNTSQAS